MTKGRARGFILRWTFHIEWHKGYGLNMSIRRQPRHMQRVTESGQIGHLVRCEPCSGDGYLFMPLRPQDNE